MEPSEATASWLKRIASMAIWTALRGAMRSARAKLRGERMRAVREGPLPGGQPLLPGGKVSQMEMASLKVTLATRTVPAPMIKDFSDRLAHYGVRHSVVESVRPDELVVTYELTKAALVEETYKDMAARFAKGVIPEDNQPEQPLDEATRNNQEAMTESSKEVSKTQPSRTAVDIEDQRKDSSGSIDAQAPEKGNKAHGPKEVPAEKLERQHLRRKPFSDYKRQAVVKASKSPKTLTRARVQKKIKRLTLPVKGGR